MIIILGVVLIRIGIFLFLFFGFLTLQVQAKEVVVNQFPVRLVQDYGELIIAKQPKRVVSVGYVSHDFILSLGVKPIALRRWYGNYPNGVWPWAKAALGNAKPTVMWGSINIEQIAALKPDLIIAIMSGISRSEYRILSKIAPTLVGPSGSGLFNVSWQNHTRFIAKALGRTAVGELQIAQLENRLAQIRQSHKQWQGKSASIWWAGKESLVYASFDPRARLIEQMGFRTPAGIDNMVNPKYEFYAKLSREALPDFDTDVLIWFDASDYRHIVRNMPLRKTMRVFREGREVYTDRLLSAALAHSSPLSLNYALDRLVPMLEQAIDGNPKTQVSSMLKAGLLATDKATP